MEFLCSLMQRGGPVMWPLLLCSIVSLAITVERLIFWWRERSKENPALVAQIFKLAEQREYDKAAQLVPPSSNACAKVLAEGLIHREHGLSAAMQVEAGKEVERMKQGLAVLDTIVTMAPLLGILGTVTGIINSFNLLGQSGAEDPKAVAGGIAEALITTAAGLVVALLTLVPYNYFVVRTQQAAKRVEHLATQFEVAYRRSQGKETD
jgi:biopolymer transport protein ExbB